MLVLHSGAQQDYRVAIDAIVDSVPWTNLESEFIHATADGLAISKDTLFYTVQAGEYNPLNLLPIYFIHPFFKGTFSVFSDVMLDLARLGFHS